MEYDDEELDAEANRVNLINQALEELEKKIIIIIQTKKSLKMRIMIYGMTE